jgi:hypothetical protein
MASAPPSLIHFHFSNRTSSGPATVLVTRDRAYTGLDITRDLIRLSRVNIYAQNIVHPLTGSVFYHCFRYSLSTTSNFWNTTYILLYLYSFNSLYPPDTLYSYHHLRGSLSTSSNSQNTTTTSFNTPQLQLRQRDHRQIKIVSQHHTQRLTSSASIFAACALFTSITNPSRRARVSSSSAGHLLPWKAQEGSRAKGGGWCEV